MNNSVNQLQSPETTRKKLTEAMIYNLPVLRARLGISQKDLAETIGVSRQTFNSIETKKREMPWTMFLALVAFFQNNEETKRMLFDMEGFKEEMDSYSSFSRKT